MAATLPSSLDPKIHSLLGELRGRIRRYIALDSALAAAAVVLGLFWFGLAIDLVPVKLGGTEMPRSARVVLLVVGGALLGLVLLRLFVGRMLRRLPDDSLALLIERHHPELAGRLITTVQLHRPRQVGDHYSTHLLDQVHQEAAQRCRTIDPGRVFRWKPVLTKAAVVVPLVCLSVGLAVASPSTIRQAAQRLLLLDNTPWPRLADLRMIGVEVPLVTPTDAGNQSAMRLREFEDKRVRVARGGAATLKIMARAEGAKVPEICTVYYRTASGLRGQVNMRRIGKIQDGFQNFALDGPPLSGLVEDVTLTIQGLDDRLDDYHIEAVEPPNITRLDVEATYPPYLRPENAAAGPDLQTAYQPGLRLREGAAVRLRGHSSTPLAGVQAAVTYGEEPPQIVPVDMATDEQAFSLALADLRAPTTVVLVPVDKYQISAPSPYRYFLGVVADAPPEVHLRLLGIGSTITPQVRIPVSGTASDDYGIADLGIRLAPVADDPKPAYSAPAVPDREGEFATTIDVRDLSNAGKLPPFEPGQAWNLYGEARDAYNLGEEHLTRTDLLRLEVVTPETLLAGLERRELGLRTRLEQTISEVETLRELLERLQREGWPSEPAQQNTTSVSFMMAATEPQDDADEEADDADPAMPRERAVQLLRLRVQQAQLQASKTAEELNGIAASIDDILLEMVNNRVDTPDRSQRIAEGVRDPLLEIVEGSLQRLRVELDELLTVVEDSARGRASAGVTVQVTEEVLQGLRAVLDKMLDLESYNEVLDLVRGLIDSQEELIEATEAQRAQSLQDLFKGIE